MDKDFGNKIRERRKKLKLTLKDVESLTGINQGYLSKLENSKNNASLETIFKLNQVLKFEDDLIIRKSKELYGINIGKKTEEDEKLNELIKLIMLYKGRGNMELEETIDLLQMIKEIIKSE